MLAFPGRFEPRDRARALAALLSAALHLTLLVVILMSGGRNDGVGDNESAYTQLALHELPDAEPKPADLTPLDPRVATRAVAESMQPAIEPPAPLAIDVPTDLVDAQVASATEPSAAIETAVPEASEPTATLVMPSAEQAAFSQRLERLAEEFARAPQSRVNWEQDGKQYSAVLIQERANDGMALDRVIAEVSAASGGRKLTTRVLLKRLAFSQFTQMVDHWDPMVQLHDDVIVGRFHSNSRFNVLYDSGTAPTFLGKVTTAARTFDLQSRGRRRESEIFRAGIETRASRIQLPQALRPAEWAPPDENARIHELAGDTRIRFFADGSYSWQLLGSEKADYLNAPSEHPVYFIGRRGSTLYVKGVVAGKILVYSPQKIVVEGNLTYARDPRETADARDYLGLVSDKYIEVAPPGVTGPGDLEIDAAIFAGRRFVVRDIDHHRSATLRIFGSLSAGSLSASEPRYATRIEYDARFEQRRPPGFPSTDRYEVENWDGLWTEVPERTADGGL